MDSYTQDVVEFHKRFGFPVGLDVVPEDVAQYRINRISEESMELIDALEAGDRTAICREAVDLIYITLGTLVTYGLPFQSIWELVHEANMQKIPNTSGGKPLKTTEALNLPTRIATCLEEKNHDIR